jgi:predicted nucleic acid-binding protein
MKIKIYLDTSVPSAFYDYSKPLRQLITQKWFENEAQNFNLFISVLTIDEIDKLKNLQKQNNIKSLILKYNINIVEITEKVTELANIYISNEAIPASEPEDALHIAAATIHQLDGIASWNFKHIVSFNPIRKIHEINKKLNYPLLEIGSLELFGGSKYGNV